MNVLGVIPARYSSSRLPGKVLLDIAGKPMVQWVYERAAVSSCLDALVVATDDERVVQAVHHFGGKAVMTDPCHPNGSSRAAEVARAHDVDFVINIQGDEPLMDPRMITETVNALSRSGRECATLCRPLEDKQFFDNPHVVKVVRDLQGDALYFSRSLLPYPREGFKLPVYEHVGIYGYTRDFLFRYVELESTPLAETESLEQLRILEHGYKIRVDITKCPQLGPNVNTEEDLSRVRTILGGA